jgi:hypothetical protein
MHSRACLVITVSGLPDAGPASITVTGPGNFAQAITATTTLALAARRVRHPCK